MCELNLNKTEQEIARKGGHSVLGTPRFYPQIHALLLGAGASPSRPDSQGSCKPQMGDREGARFPPEPLPPRNSACGILGPEDSEAEPVLSEWRQWTMGGVCEGCGRGPGFSQMSHLCLGQEGSEERGLPRGPKGREGREPRGRERGSAMVLTPLCPVRV